MRNSTGGTIRPAGDDAADVKWCHVGNRDGSCVEHAAPNDYLCDRHREEVNYSADGQGAEMAHYLDDDEY